MTEKRVALITGASRGIGEGIARELAAQGYAIACAQRTDSPVDGALSIRADLREPKAANHVVDAVLAQYGRIDVLVNNAGATKRGDFFTLTDEDFSDGFALKYFGNVRLTRAAWPELEKSQGSVLSIVGVGGWEPGAEFTIGGSVNAALFAFTKALAEIGVRDGVQVNAVNPGAVATARLKTRLDAYVRVHGGDEDGAKAALVKNMGITRFGETSDIAGLVAFIVSPRGRWLQGALINMDGGQIKHL